MCPGIAFRTETMESRIATDSTIPARSGARQPGAKQSLPWRVIKLGGTSVDDPGVLDHLVHALRAARREASMVLVVSARGALTDRLVALIDGLADSSVDAASELAEIGAEHRDYLAQVTHASEVRSRRARPTGTRSSEGQRPETPTPAVAWAQERMAVDLRVASSLCDRAREAGLVAPAVRAQVLATGERLAATILVARLAHAGMMAERIDATELIVATGAVLDATPDLAATHARTASRLAASGHSTLGRVAGARRILVVPGFFATGPTGQLHLLGRGGSDTSATTLGAALGAASVEIWTDVDGVYPSDPRRDPCLCPFPRLTYQEAECLARAGARVLHAKSITPVRQTATPLIVRNAFRPEAPGTRIGAHAAAPSRHARPVVAGDAS